MPVVATQSVSSVYSMPMVMSAAKAMAMDGSWPTSAAAKAASMMFVIVETCSVTMAATRMAANPASPEPSAEFAVASEVGRQTDRGRGALGSRPPWSFDRRETVYLLHHSRG